MSRTLDDFAEQHGAAKLKRIQHDLDVERAKVLNLAGTKENVTVVMGDENNRIRFGVISDTHYGSLYSMPDHVAAFYKACAAEGIKTVLHAGDVLDGWKVYKGQEFELADIGWEEQLARFENSAPEAEGITTYFITGNHDSSFKNLVGMDVGQALQTAREDWRYLGQDSAVIDLHTANGTPYRVQLQHPDGGTAYALSYKMQRGIESLEGGRKPQMLIQGHFHKSEFLPSYRNVAGLQAGCFQWQTPFLVRKASAAHPGGWLVEVIPGKNYNRIKAEFVAFYRDATPKRKGR